MFLKGGVKGEKRDGWGATQESAGNYLRAFGEEDVVSVYTASFFLSSLAPFWPLKHSICFLSCSLLRSRHLYKECGDVLKRNKNEMK